MIKRATFVMGALLAVGVATSTAPAKPLVEVSVDPQAAKAEAKLRKAAARAERAAREAGISVNLSGGSGRSGKKSKSANAMVAASARREAVKRAIRNRLNGGNLVNKDK